MSAQYPGGIISKTAPVPSGPYANSTAPGIWTLEQQAALAKQGNWPTAGNVNPSAFIENLFSTYLYSGTGASQNIVNGIDLSTNGGLVWIKSRTSNVQAWNHSLTDTVRGNASRIYSNLTGAANSAGTPNGFTYNSNGFTVGVSDGTVNNASETYASWTFCKQAKFFDVQTATSSGGVVTFNHNLGVAPGMVIIKGTNGTDNWMTYHISLGVNQYVFLNDTAAAGSYAGLFTSSSTQFSLNSLSSPTQYVAYLFAPSNSGGFGLTGTDNVISCGSYTGDGTATGPTVNLGYEPQWLLVKKSSGAQDWFVFDNMRGVATGGNDYYLRPNSSGAETTGGDTLDFTATGFIPKGSFDLNTSGTYIYIAIRRGPMKVPTSGTSVYENTAYTGNGASDRLIGSSVLTDLLLLSNLDASASGWALYAQYFFDRLRGQNFSLSTANTNAEVGGWTTYFNLDMNTGWDTGGTTDQVYLNKTSSTFVSNAFKRAPSFFDVVCYTGDGTSPRSITHNLGIAPELMIVKKRNTGDAWAVGVPVIGATKELWLNSTIASYTDAQTFSSAPTSTVFNIGFNGEVNTSGGTYVAYLFATCPNVSKVGSYTGTGALQTVNCGFTSGARFVLIKRTDSTGDWYVWDSARGIVAGNDPYLLLNSTAAEVTGTNYVDTDTTGFKVTAAAPAGLNANGGTYIFLAIA